MIYIDRIIAAVCIRADNKNGAEIPSDIDSRRNLLDAIFYRMIYCKKQQAGIRIYTERHGKNHAENIGFDFRRNTESI